MSATDLTTLRSSAVPRRFGLDSTEEVTASAHHAVGSTVALRYLGHYTPKVITRAEYLRYKAANIDLVLVFEDDGRPDLHSYLDGKTHAEFALKQALDAIRTPARPLRIRAAADYDPAGVPSRADGYFDGWGAVIPRERCGPYGNDEMLAHQHARGFRTLWQTYAWSAGRFFSSDDNTAYQYSNDHNVGGVGTDFNHLYFHDFGQVDYAGPPSDPHHYERFQDHRFGRPYTERWAVQRYDVLRRHPFVHRPELASLRHNLWLFAARIREVARMTDPPAWGAYYRGVPHGGRYHQLTMRARGERVVAW